MSTDTLQPLDVEQIRDVRRLETTYRETLITLHDGGPTVTPAHGGFTLVARDIQISYVRKGDQPWRLAIVTVSGPPLDGHRGHPMIYAGVNRIADFRFESELAGIPWLARLVHENRPKDGLPGHGRTETHASGARQASHPSPT